MMSVISMVLMVTLFLSELISFMTLETQTSVMLDANTDTTLRINFNVTFLELHCDYLSVDVWDSIGTNRQNVTKNVEKWQVNASILINFIFINLFFSCLVTFLTQSFSPNSTRQVDSEGNKKVFQGRNKEVRMVKYEEHDKTLEELHENGVHAVPLTTQTFNDHLSSTDHGLVFVNFYAPWCIWCQRLHPTWESFAEYVEEEEMPLSVVQVDCVENAKLCSDQRIGAFPTLRWFQDGKAVMPDYKSDRTVSALNSYATRKLDAISRYKDWEEKAKTNREY